MTKDAFCSGICLPITSGTFIYLLLTEQEDSSLPCSILVSFRIFLAYVILAMVHVAVFVRLVFQKFQTLVYFIFKRYILVKFSDRGLVEKGAPNLGLLCHVFWLSSISIICASFAQFPLVKMIKGNFPHNSVKGQICLQTSTLKDEKNTYHRILGYAFPLIFAFFNLKFWRSMSVYSKSQNLSGRTFSQFGGNKMRNIITGKQTTSYLFVVVFFIILDNTLIIVFQHYGDMISVMTRFNIHNIFWILFLEVFFGLYVPIRHIILSRKYLPSLWSAEEPKMRTDFSALHVMKSPRRTFKGARSLQDILTDNACERHASNSMRHYHVATSDALCPVSI